MPTINVEGMSCEHCVNAVTEALTRIEGVKNPKVDLAGGNVTFDEDWPVDMNRVIEEVDKAGYRVG